MPLKLQTSKGRLPKHKIIYHAVESIHWAKDFPLRVPGMHYESFCHKKGLWWQDEHDLMEIEPEQICKKCLRMVGKVIALQKKLTLELAEAKSSREEK